MSPHVRHCRSCGAEIIWSWTENGKRMPVDAMPREDGNILLTEYPDGYIEAAYVQSSLFEEWDQDAPEPRRYVSHFASCSEATRWRKS